MSFDLKGLSRLGVHSVVAGLAWTWAGSGFAQEAVRPSTVDARIVNGNSPYLVYGGDTSRRGAPLVIFLPGTYGTSAAAPQLLLHTVLEQGYRVVFLSYDDRVAGTNLCPKAPPGCFQGFRASRVLGGAGPVRTSYPEAIVPRLEALLRYLDREHPEAGWNSYLTPAGPAWSRIVVSGLSQGAGMAAFIAKRFPVRRVVLFSSPWDFTLPGVRPAGWLYERSVTPPSRWWAERHVSENATRAITRAYAALRIPQNHILLFRGPPPNGPSSYHWSTIILPRYVPQWRIMYGRAFDDGSRG